MGRKSDDQKQAEKEMAKFDINYATRQDLCDRALSTCIEIIRNAKNNRKSKEVEWLEDLRLWACQQSDSQMYQGRSNLVIPELHSQVESSVGQFMEGLFPNDDYVGCVALKNTNDDDAKQISAAVYHELNNKNNLPALMERFERQKVLYGTAFLKPVFEKTMKTVIVNNDGYAKPSVVPMFQGVRVLCQDTFHTYVWPETVSDIQKAVMVFDEEMPSQYEVENDDKYVNTKDIPELNTDFSDYGWVDTVRMTIANLSTATATQRKGILLTECWLDFDIVSGTRVPCVVTIANYNRVIRIQRNPFWHQLKPYLQGRYIKGPAGEVYGHSLPEKLRSLHYMMQDLGNQTMDSLTYTLNPLALIDPGFAGDVNSFKISPGARWFANPEAVRFVNFPDISQAGFMGMSQVRAMLSQFSDLTPGVAPQLTGKVRSATQSSDVQNRVNQKRDNMTLSDEFEVMSPLCDMTHWLLKQFQTDEYQIIQQGPEKGQWITKNVNPKTLAKDVLFIWRGSEVAQKNSVRSQQILAAFNMAVQMEQAIPGQIDLSELYKRAMYESFDLKDLNVFIADKDKKTVDPDIENISLVGGEDCEVNTGDNYDVHMRSHMLSFEAAKDDAEAKLAHIKHMERHQIQKKAKDLLLQQQAKIQSMQMQLGQGGPQGQPGPGQQGPGNKMQIAQSPDAVMKGVRGMPNNL